MSQLRYACGAVLAGFCVWAAATAAPVELPKESAKAATAADVEAIQKLAEKIGAEPGKNKGAIRTVKGLVLTIAVYGDEATQGQAAKVLLALDKKDYAGAAEAAKGLSSPKADAAAVKGIDKKFELDDVMSPFRLAQSGGMNIEKDIRTFAKGGITPKAAEVIGMRVAALATYTEKMPNEKANTNPATKSKWEKISKDMAAASKELAEEGGKGAKANEKSLTTIIKKLEATCLNCHTEFRDE